MEFFDYIKNNPDKPWDFRYLSKKPKYYMGINSWSFNYKKYVKVIKNTIKDTIYT